MDRVVRIAYADQQLRSRAANDTGEGVFRLTFAPEFQNIVKDENQTIAIGALAESEF